MANPSPRRHVYLVMYSERPLPATTPIPYSKCITSWTNGISMTPNQLSTTQPTTTSTQKIEIVTLSNRASQPKILSFMFNAQYGPPTANEPHGRQQVWLCGWSEYQQDAGWIVEENIRREEVGGGKGLSTMQSEWEWTWGQDGWLKKAVFETEKGSLLQYDVLRVEVRG